MGHNKRPRYNTAEPSPKLPSVADENKQETTARQQHSNAKAKPGEKRFWNMTVSERIMAILTAIGLVIAVFTGLIFWKQLKEMRADQRAWINVSSGQGQLAKDANGNGSVTVPMTITNTGKTPARAIFTEVVVEKVKNGDDPEFIYENRARTYESTGTIFPNATQNFTAALLKGKIHAPGEPDTEVIWLTPFQLQDLTDGSSYLAVYVRSSYTDVFDTTDWVHYCAFATLVPKPMNFTAKKCTDYNNIDNN